MTTIPSPRVRADVQHQYELLPYPERDPAHELELLRQPTLCEVPRLRALLGEPAGSDRPLRILDAGAGTGDNTVFLATQLAGTGSEIVALDFSETALAINRARLAARGLQDVRHVHAPIEEAPELGLGRFDAIISSGVLHHLDSPEDGLAALRSMLAPGGVLGLMVYATYGREPVYRAQAVLRRLAPVDLAPEERLRLMRKALRDLPRGSRTLRELEDHPVFGPEIAESDAGAYDLLLHTQDRAYTVPELCSWVHGAGLDLAEWTVPAHYEPATYLDARLLVHLERGDGCSAAERAAVAELAHGGMIKHELFVRAAGVAATEAGAEKEAGPETEDAVPAWCPWQFSETVSHALRALAEGREIRCTFGTDRLVVVPGDRVHRAFLASIDGASSVGDVLRAAHEAAPSTSARELRKRWLECARQFQAMGAIAFRPAS